MGFKSVRRVEVKAETTTPGELRAATDASGARVGASRGRRTLPKLEFTVDEDGAVLHGPQRGSYPFYAAEANAVSPAAVADAPFNTALERDLAASFQALHMRDFPSPDADAAPRDEPRDDAPPPQMKECVLNDTRATTLALKYDNAVGKFVCGSSIERFSGHTGVCRVLGSKKYPVISHSLRLGDLLRIGSVGLVVCELNRTTSEDTEEALTNEQYEFLKENYLSLPLQQTFHPTERSPDLGDSGDHDDKDHERTMRVGGDTSDEGESEEDKDRKGRRRSSGGAEETNTSRENSSPLGVAGTTGKRFCYICYDGDEDPENNPLVAPCHCKGDTKYVHLDCLQRWNNNLDADGTNPNQKVCAVTNTDGLDVCSICKATYLTSVRLDDGRLHAKVKYQDVSALDRYIYSSESCVGLVCALHGLISFLVCSPCQNNFLLFDAASSNGTMLFLSKPLELDWNKTLHVKIGRTILTLKAKKKWKWAGTGSGDDEDEEEAGRVSSPRISGLGSTPRGFEARLSSPGSTARGNGFDIRGSSALNDPSAELAAAPYASHLPRTYTAPNVLSSRWNRSAPSHALTSRPPRQRSLSSSASVALHGDSSADALRVLSTEFQLDELEPDEPDTFATQAVGDPVVLPASSASFRDFAAENASPSLTSQLAGESSVNVNAHALAQSQELPVQRRGLYDLVDSLSERGASPIVASLSPAGRLTEQE
ncbi:unnamed protein product [Phytophthora lilii]|uniref:Unnamed protein product n=1 Tax=Phytophthora lilii TaxID=2077276 RepID=A0A9W6WQ39_9STRA|nr:unnamed protein product [Phytophthora lilii]